MKQPKARIVNVDPQPNVTREWQRNCVLTRGAFKVGFRYRTIFYLIWCDIRWQNSYVHNLEIESVKVNGVRE